MADTTIEQFESEAQSFLESNAAQAGGGEEVRLGRGLRLGVAVRRARPPARAGAAGRGQGVAGKKFDAGFGWITGPSAYGGRELPDAYERSWDRLEGQYDVPDQGFFGIGLGMVAPTILAHATDTAKDAYLRQAVPRRHRRLPAVQRARRRLRPRHPADQGRARRRRVDHHRPEGVDVGRAVLRHRRDHLPHRPRPAQAQGPHRLHRRHEGARRRGAAAAPDDRRRVVQRGVLQRGAGARRPPPRRRQPGLDRRPHHAHERAGVDRRRRAAAARAAR